MRDGDATLEQPLSSRLAALLGNIRSTFAASDFERHARDFTRGAAEPAVPLAVAYPATTEEVAQVVKACHLLDVPIVTQGGLTGMVGGAVPTTNCLVLSLERMRRIEEVDSDAATMTVLAGTPLQTVQEAAAEAGFLFALDLGSRGACTIGGNIATNAGGNRVLRYGMMRDLVLGIEVVLADGTILSSLNKMLKNNAGYDLRGLFIGSEGTLGIVTRAVLRLHPLPLTANTALAAVPDFASVRALLKMARATLGASLSAFEVMWRDYYRVACRNTEVAPLADDIGAYYVLLDVLGANPAVDANMFQSFLEEAFETGYIVDAAVAQSVAEARRFWSIREASGELPRLWGQCVNFDVSVPIGDVEPFVSKTRSRLALVVAPEDVLVFGHLADSNLHIACRDPEDRHREAIDEAVYATVREFGGSISAEHGIGTEKRGFLAYSRSHAELAVMRMLKDALDPRGLLNPGKLL